MSVAVAADEGLAIATRGLRKTFRTVRNLVLGFGIPILALVVFYFVTTRDSDRDDAGTTTTGAAGDGG